MTTGLPATGTYRLPENLEAELTQLERMVARMKAAELTPEQFRAHRVPMGVYEQRESGTYMLRVRFPAGAVLPTQMRALAAVAEKHGNGVLHVTTRQDIQVHRVPLDSVCPALRELLAAGLSTRGGGGNTVRNITACRDAGVCPHQAFDVSPHAVAVTEFLLPDPISYQLPRKYKIAFSGCKRDCAGVCVNDLGFVATRQDGVDGFTVYAGGGMGAHSRVGELLEEFIPAPEAPLVAEAVKRVFDRHGNRKHRHRARLRFLVEQIGFPAFRDLYRTELRAVRESDAARVPQPRAVTVPPAQRDRRAEEGGLVTEGFEAWQAVNVREQIPPGYTIVQVPLFLGDIATGTLRALADVVEIHGDGILRADQSQNLALRWVPSGQLPALYAKLEALGLAGRQAPALRNLVPCAGASTCQLGICRSRGLAEAISKRLQGSDLNLQAMGELNIGISGCPNACGRHPVAQIGFSGAARRVQGRLSPHYAVHLGGVTAAQNTRLARNVGMVAARDVPDFLTRFLKAFSRSAAFPDFDAFLNDGGLETARALIADYQDVPSFTQDENYYFDWGADVPFSLAGRGPGECGSGVFELIEMDLRNAEAAYRQSKHMAAAALAARALLVTRGEQAGSDREAFELFRKHFVHPGLVTGSAARLVEKALNALAATGTDDTTGAQTGVPELSPDLAPEVAALVRTVMDLYHRMDDSLRLPACEVISDQSTATRTAVDAAEACDQERDFRGVDCPLNYVKAKLVLEQMQSGQVLSMLLDEPGAKNVPASLAADGHEVLVNRMENDHWRVVVRKA